jgi:hypothetical protein
MKNDKAICISYKQTFTNHIEFDSTFDDIISTIENLYNINLLDRINNGMYFNTIEEVDFEYEIEDMLLFVDDELINIIQTKMEEDKNIQILRFEDVTKRIINEDKCILNEFSVSDEYIFEYKENVLGKDGILDKIASHGIGSLTEIDFRVLEQI